MSPSPLERFEVKIDKQGLAPGGCWLWTAALNPQTGYAQFHTKSGTKTGHAWAYEWFKGPVPSGLQLDHLCRIRHCVAPHHLEPVTQALNLRRGEPANRKVCPNGHVYTKESTYYRKDKGREGQRQCKICGRDNKRKRNEATRSSIRS